jgi:protein LTV1
MSSSAMHRSEQLTLLDDRFDKLLEEYECSDSDEEVVDLPPVDFSGLLLKTLDKAFDEFLDEEQGEDIQDIQLPMLERQMHACKILDEVVEQDAAGEFSDASDDMHPWDRPEAQVPQWDCETVLSTYSNIYNRPKLLDEAPAPKQRIRLTRRGFPVTESAQVDPADETDGSDATVINLGQARAKDEPKEDKKSRKSAIKEERRQRRAEKKATKEAFKQEIARRGGS